MEKIKNSKDSEEIFNLIDSVQLEIGKKIIADDVLENAFLFDERWM